MNLPKPALSPLSATIRLLPTTTMSIVRIDLTFLSFKASIESKKTSLMFNSDHVFFSLSYFFWAFRSVCGMHVKTAILTIDNGHTTEPNQTAQK